MWTLCLIMALGWPSNHHCISFDPIRLSLTSISRDSRLCRCCLWNHTVFELDHEQSCGCYGRRQWTETECQSLFGMNATRSFQQTQFLNTWDGKLDSNIFKVFKLEKGWTWPENLSLWLMYWLWIETDNLEEMTTELADAEMRRWADEEMSRCVIIWLIS